MRADSPTGEPGRENASWRGPRRRKSAMERRAQRLRAEARCVQRLLRGLSEVHAHRGGALGIIGQALLRALQEMSGRDASVAADSCVGTAAEGAAPCAEGAPVSAAGATCVPEEEQSQPIHRVFIAAEKTRIRVAGNRMADTHGFLEAGASVRGADRGDWIQLESGGFVMSHWSDGGRIMIPGD